jgi:rhomboid family GlyGly-CTERM serine protease
MMTIRRMPILTVSLVMALIGLYWLAPDRTLLYFSAQEITRGETWRLLTGHFMHADPEHLMWNGLGLAILGMLIEQYSRTMLWAALGAGIICVNVLLLSPFAQLDYYCGLSGVLNTLLLVALWLEWQATRSWLILAIAGGSIAKSVIEVSLGESIMTHISWPPYAWSHVAGLVGGLITVWCLLLRAHCPGSGPTRSKIKFSAFLPPLRFDQFSVQMPGRMPQDG